MRKEHNGNKCVVLHIWLPLHKILNINRKQGRIKNAIKLCVGFHLETLNEPQMPSHIQSFLFSIFFLHLGSPSPPSPAYYSPSAEAEEEQALMNRLLIDQNFSDGIDYADPKDDRGLHSHTMKRYLKGAFLTVPPNF